MRTSRLHKYITCFSVSLIILASHGFAVKGGLKNDSVRIASEALDKAKSSGDMEQVVICEKELSNAYAAKGQWQNALQAMKEYALFHDSIAAFKQREQIKLSDKKRAEERELAIRKAEREKIEAVQSAELKYKATLAGFIIIMIAAIAVLSVLIIKYMKARKNQNTVKTS